MIGIKLRITVPEECVCYIDGPNDVWAMNDIRTMAERYFKKYVATYEVGSKTDKPHTHWFALVETENDYKNLRQYIQKNIGKGNGVYSLKKTKEEFPTEYLSYILKDKKISVGQHRYVIYKGYERKELSELPEYIPQSNKGPVWKQILEFHKYSENSTRAQIVYDVVEWYKQKELVIREQLLVSNVQTILVTINPEYRRQFERKILEKL